MARTLQQILAQINEEADKQAVLATLQTNTSRVSVWRYAKQTVAFAIRTLEEMFDTHKQQVQQIIDSRQIGTPAWYATQAKAFQLGEPLALINNVPGYASDNPDAQIIRHAAVEEGTGSSKGTVIIKAVKEMAAVLMPLSAVEKAAFQGYMEQITFAGIQVQVKSEAAQELTLHATIQVDHQLIDSKGKRVGTAEQPVEEAVANYLRTLPFNGLIRRTALEDAIQQVPGVIDLATYANSAKTQSLATTQKPDAGHAVLAAGSTFAYQNTRIN